jgi:hypothetical protein
MNERVAWICIAVMVAAIAGCQGAGGYARERYASTHCTQ